MKIVLFHYSQLDFRKCLKAPKTAPKWPDQLNSSSSATCVNSKSNLYSKSNSSSNANSNSYATLDALSDSKQKTQKWRTN